MKLINIIYGAAYIGPDSGFSWIPTLAVIVVGIFLFWIVYKLVLRNLKGPDREKKEEPVPIVTQSQGKAYCIDGTVRIGPKEEHIIAEEEIVTPMSGRLMPITEVPDPVFSEKMVGDGFAIEPNQEEIFAPVSGQVMQIYSNKDALTIKTLAGRDVIVHIGINTINLKGEGILFYVKEGDKVNAGELIGKIDLAKVIPLIPTVISPIVFPSLKGEKVVIKQTGMVQAKMKGIIVIEKEEQ